MRTSSIFAAFILATIPAFAAPTAAPRRVLTRPSYEVPHHFDTESYVSGFYKRADGGDAQSGTTGDVQGGSVTNSGSRDGMITNDGMGTCKTCLHPIFLNHR